MTSYIKQAVLGPVVSPLVSNDKGDVSNRMSCAGAQFKNNLSTLAQDVAVIGGAAVATKGITKNTKLTEKFASGFNKIVNKLMPGVKRDITIIKKSGFPFKTFEIRQSKLAQKLLSMPSKAKVALSLMLPALAVTGFITNKAIYKMGQIDQKYSDKAAIREHQKEILD